jgi:hypothetical protein
MRTKTLLLTAALGVIGAASSMAQVYSVNSVGYINLTLAPGFNLVANQLNATGNNRLDTVLPAAPLETQVLKFANNNYSSDISDGSAWFDNSTGNPSTTTISPGDGFFYFNPGGTPVTATLVGEVPQGDVGFSMAPGYNLVSSKVPQDISLTAANGFPQVLEALYLTFNSATQNYNSTLINDGSAWFNNDTGEPADARPTVGQGFFIFNPGATPMAWVRTFSVNP